MKPVVLELPRVNGRGGSHLIAVRPLWQDDGIMITGAALLVPRASGFKRREVWWSLRESVRYELLCMLVDDLSERADYARAEMRDYEGRL